MTLTPAPLFTDIAGGPPDGAAYWVTTSDDLRIRVGIWRPSDARGTVLMFPGRSEYIEKYGDTASELCARGYATLVIDWRGQGLADHLLADRRIGHVTRFSDYQRDVTAALSVAAELDLPRPYHLLGHSMGGCIGLRAVTDGLDVASCGFTGPMWGIRFAAHERPLGWMTAFLGPLLGQGHQVVPKSTLRSYVLVQPFDDNMLTTDPQMYQMMRDQLEAHPDLALGGPSVIWLREALMECRALAALPSPDLPCVTFLGTRERIVDTACIHQRMANWPGGDLEIVQGGEHEVLMETPEIRQATFDRLDRLFTKAASAARDA